MLTDNIDKIIYFKNKYVKTNYYMIKIDIQASEGYIYVIGGNYVLLFSSLVELLPSTQLDLHHQTNNRGTKTTLKQLQFLKFAH